MSGQFQPCRERGDRCSQSNVADRNGAGWVAECNDDFQQRPHQSTSSGGHDPTGGTIGKQGNP